MKYLKKACILLFWLCVWGGIAYAVHNSILLAGPVKTLQSLVGLLKTAAFYRTVLRTLLRITAGFLGGLGAAFLLAFLASKSRFAEELLSPVMHLLAAMPLASFVVLLLIWWGASFLAVAVSFLIVLPVVYLSTLEGIRAVDAKMLEMAAVHRLPGRTVFFYIVRPALAPFLAGSIKTAAGLAWKAGVAAEVIGVPDYSIGEKLYLSKVYLETGELLAWTAVILLLSFGFEKLVLWILQIFMTLQPHCRKPRRSLSEKTVAEAIHLHKAFGEEKVLQDISFSVLPSKTYYLRHPSGAGKTTLLRILAGLETADSGTAHAGETSMCFQEDRLCENYSAVKNVEMVTGDEERARQALLLLMDADSVEKPCSRLSGGMKRRVALVRAMEADSDTVLLDEPFTGLDEKTRAVVENYLVSKQGDRPMLIASHI